MRDYGNPKKRSRIREISGKDKIELLRKRNVDEIIKSGFITGCGDIALAYATIARSRGIPIQFIEAVQEDCLRDLSKGDDNHSMRGHVFLQAKVEGKWYLMDPSRKSSDGKCPNVDFSGELCEEVKPGAIIDGPKSKQ